MRFGERLVPVLLPGLSLFVLGCGPDGPHTVPVRGVVTIDGKPPTAAGTIFFTPLEAAEGSPTRPGIGEFDTTGHYAAQTFEPGDGLLPGRYRLKVHCWKTPPNMDGRPVVSYIAAKYESVAESDLAELIVETRSGQVECNLDLQAR